MKKFILIFLILLNSNQALAVETKPDPLVLLQTRMFLSEVLKLESPWCYQHIFESILEDFLAKNERWKETLERIPLSKQQKGACLMHMSGIFQRFATK